MMCGCESRLGPLALDIQLGTSHAPGKAGKVKRPSGPGWQWFGRLSMVHLEEIPLRYMGDGIDRRMK